MLRASTSVSRTSRAGRPSRKKLRQEFVRIWYFEIMWESLPPTEEAPERKIRRQCFFFFFFLRLSKSNFRILSFGKRKSHDGKISKESLQKPKLHFPNSYLENEIFPLFALLLALVLWCDKLQEQGWRKSPWLNERTRAPSFLLSSISNGRNWRPRFKLFRKWIFFGKGWQHWLLLHFCCPG